MHVAVLQGFQVACCQNLCFAFPPRANLSHPFFFSFFHSFFSRGASSPGNGLIVSCVTRHCSLPCLCFKKWFLNKGSKGVAAGLNTGCTVERNGGCIFINTLLSHSLKWRRNGVHQPLNCKKKKKWSDLRRCQHQSSRNIISHSAEWDFKTKHSMWWIWKQNKM